MLDTIDLWLTNLILYICKSVYHVINSFLHTSISTSVTYLRNIWKNFKFTHLTETICWHTSFEKSPDCAKTNSCRGHVIYYLKYLVTTLDWRFLEYWIVLFGTFTYFNNCLLDNVSYRGCWMILLIFLTMLLVYSTELQTWFLIHICHFIHLTIYL